ncbi:hypothetical protein [Variovorax sp. LjRoot178]|uniref:hypothetical protein n=1 Tax=Variovorax sp. LjRoot178 TaxID=3342277 RepID=UPI003ECD9F9E
MKFEPTLPGNPHQLVVNQHIFPRSAIQRFADVDGTVQVERLASSVTFRTRPTDRTFCARRAWDQATETVRSHPIEKTYAALADQLVSGEVQTLTPEMDKTVSEFFFLWNHRFNAATIPGEDLTLNFVAPERQLTKAQEEILERKGVMFVRGNKLPFRFINGMSIMRETDRGMERMASAKWGIVRAAEGEFLVPDNCVGLSVVPVSPTICLADGAGDISLVLKSVGTVNRQLKDGAREFVFARDLAACPVVAGAAIFS